MMKQQVLVIHGGDTFETTEYFRQSLRTKEVSLDRLMSHDWKSSLAEKLGENFEVIFPRMPNAQNAKYEEWKIWMGRIAPLLSPEVILIGHSLGGIFLAKYLNEEKWPSEILTTILIAAPFSAAVGETLGDFELPESLEGLAKQGGRIFLFHSQDDPVVPFSNLDNYCKALPKAQVRIFTDKQHFNQEEFPELVKEIKDII